MKLSTFSTAKIWPCIKHLHMCLSTDYTGMLKNIRTAAVMYGSIENYVTLQGHTDRSMQENIAQQQDAIFYLPIYNWQFYYDAQAQTRFFSPEPFRVLLSDIIFP